VSAYAFAFGRLGDEEGLSDFYMSVYDLSERINSAICTNTKSGL
jgi:hypothetical protein